MGSHGAAIGLGLWFSCGMGHCGKGFVAVFRGFSGLVLAGVDFGGGGGGMGTGLSLYGVWTLPNIS